MIRILTKNGVDNTNVDGARDHNFNAGRRSGIVQGALNQGNFFASNNNTIALDTCELRLCGHRIVLDKAEYRTFTNKPSVPVRYSFVARVVVDSDDNVSFEFVSQEATTQLVQDNLDITGSGTYELEIGKFTQLTDGNITDVVRTADLITGGAGGGDSEYIRIGTVTTNKISPELDADVDIENTINPADNKPQTNFTFNLPTAVGTVVSVNGEEKTAINTDTTPTANSENLITSGGVHDYPAITFAESERQKSKNLLNYEDIIPTTGLTTDNNGTFYIDTTSYYVVRQLNISFEPNKTYTMSCNVVSITGGNNPTLEFAVRYKDGEWAGYGSDIITGAGIATASFTPTKEVDLFELRFIRQNPAGQRLQATINNLQMEEGSVATDYQPYNGQISHTGDKEIGFARNEYEKSKNLWNSEDIKIGYDRVTYNKDTNTFTYTMTSAIVGENTEMAILSYGKLKAGNYIVSFTATSSVGNDAPIIVCEIDNNNNFVTSIGTIYLIDGYKTIPFSLTEEKRIGLAWYYKAGWIAGDAPAGTKTLTNIQLEEGSIATDFQPYNGAILHKSEVKPILVYDRDTKNTINGTAHTAGLYTSGLYIKDNIPNDVTRLRIYYANQYVSIIDNGGTHNVCELDIRDRNTAWCETCVVNAHKSDTDAVDDTLFKLLLALDQAGYMNIKFFKNTTKIEDGTSYVYRIEGIR